MFTNTQKKSINDKNKAKATIRFSDFSIDKLMINQVEDNKMNAGQRISIPKYKQDSYGDSLVQLQTPPVYLFTYGIPKPGAFYKDEAARSFVKVPEDVNDPNSLAFFNTMESIDKYLTSIEGKKKIFGSEKVASNYVYQPIVRTPENKQDEEDDDEDEDENDKKRRILKKQETSDLGPKPRYMKFKIDLDWETKAIKTKVLVKNDEGKREPVTGIVTLEDINKYIRYKSTNTMVIMWNKIYASKNKLGDSKKYGAGFKITQSLCEKPSDSKYNNDEDAFIDDEDFIGAEHTLSNVKITVEQEPNLLSNSVKVDISKNTVSSALDNNDEEDEDEDEDEDDEEDEPVVKNTVAVKKTTTTAGRKPATK